VPDQPTPRRNPTRRAAPAGPAWVREHRRVVFGAGAVLVVAIVVAVLFTVGGSGGGAPAVAPGSIVGNGPLTSGYRLSGVVKARSATTVTVLISRVDASAGEARNVVIRPGATIEFEHPADGTVAVARNGHVVPGTGALHVGDSVVLVGEFTNVGPGRQGYAFIGIEASS
jgi:sulfur carrier protein ThiS